MIAVVVRANHNIDTFASGNSSKFIREPSAETSINETRKPISFEIEGVSHANIECDKSVRIPHFRSFL